MRFPPSLVAMNSKPSLEAQGPTLYMEWAGHNLLCRLDQPPATLMPPFELQAHTTQLSVLFYLMEHQSFLFLGYFLYCFFLQFYFSLFWLCLHLAVFGHFIVFGFSLDMMLAGVILVEMSRCASPDPFLSPSF